MDDLSHMRAALALARRGLGSCWPNPAVGCVIVRDGRVVGRATTAPGGRPHAETQALAMAGEAARGATAYVTLEPCCHHGGTPPCTEALIAAGIARVVIGVRDPDARVNGAGVARLRAAGIAVDEGFLQTEAEQVAAGFISRTRLGRPLVTLKLASSLDGRIATASGQSRWITGEAARRQVHALRGRHDAVMVGIGTALADDPDLTCRLERFAARAPVRIVVDSHLRLPLSSRLVATAGHTATWVLTTPGRADAPLREAGVRVTAVPARQDRVDLAAGLALLGTAGLTSVLVEGGAVLAGALLAADLVDRVVWFHAPGIMGGDGLAAASGFGVTALADMRRFVRERARPIGEDVLTELRRAA